MSQNPFFTASPKQAQFFEAVFSGQYSYLAYGGGIRSGKSATAIMLAQLLCRVYPRSRWAIVRKDLPTLRRNVLPTFSKFRVPGFTGEVNQSNWIAPCVNGSEIVFFTETLSEDPEYNRWRGLEVNGFFLEEANELQEGSFSKAIERAGSWIIPGTAQQPAPLIVATFNPSAGWVKRKFYDPWKAGNLKAPYFYLPATVTDNPYLPQTYVDSLQNLSERDYKRFVEGDWSFVSGAFFDELGANTHKTSDLRKPNEAGNQWSSLPPWWTYWGAYDWGFRHPAVAMGFARDGDGQMYVLDTVRMHKMDDESQAVQIKEALPAACCAQMFAGHDAMAKRMAHAASVESVADVFARHTILLSPANIARVQGASALRRALTTKRGTVTPSLLFCDTPGNQWALERIMEMMPDETNPDDVLKVDANEEGEGGDDGYDCARYGMASPGFLPETPKQSAPEWVEGKDDEWDTTQKRYATHRGRQVEVRDRPQGEMGQFDFGE